jgi:hypothetical protein
MITLIAENQKISESTFKILVGLHAGGGETLEFCESKWIIRGEGRAIIASLSAKLFNLRYGITYNLADMLRPPNVVRPNATFNR